MSSIIKIEKANSTEYIDINKVKGVNQEDNYWIVSLIDRSGEHRSLLIESYDKYKKIVELIDQAHMKSKIINLKVASTLSSEVIKYKLAPYEIISIE